MFPNCTAIHHNSSINEKVSFVSLLILRVAIETNAEQCLFDSFETMTSQVAVMPHMENISPTTTPGPVPERWSSQQ